MVSQFNSHRTIPAERFRGTTAYCRIDNSRSIACVGGIECAVGRGSGFHGMVWNSCGSSNVARDRCYKQAPIHSTYKHHTLVLTQTDATGHLTCLSLLSSWLIKPNNCITRSSCRRSSLPCRRVNSVRIPCVYVCVGARAPEHLYDLCVCVCVVTSINLCA